MRIGGKEMGKEAIEKVQDGNDKDRNSQSLEQWGKEDFRKDRALALLDV